MNIIRTLEVLDSIQIINNSDSCEDAVRECFQPLIENKSITAEYIEAVIQRGIASKFYYIIAPGLALPHSRPEDGCSKLGVSMLIVKNGIKFESHQYNPVHCLIGLAAPDNSTLINALVEVADFFGDKPEIIEELSRAESKKDVCTTLYKIESYHIQHIL
ncbi:MAG: PTS sugar transporter subunit IIA [Brevinema sp.]